MSGTLPAVPKTRKVELRLLDINGQPMRQADCLFEKGAGFSEFSSTDDDGRVAFDLPLTVLDGDLTVTPRADRALQLKLKVFITKLEDAGTLPGAQARLNNLGYLALSGTPAQALADLSDEPFERALARFKRANHLPPGAKDALEPAVKDRLADAHDTRTGPLTK